MSPSLSLYKENCQNELHQSQSQDSVIVLYLQIPLLTGFFSLFFFFLTSVRVNIILEVLWHLCRISALLIENVELDLLGAKLRAL